MSDEKAATQRSSRPGFARRAATAISGIPGGIKRAMYPDGRPLRLTRWVNRAAAAIYSARVLGGIRGATLRVRGRRSGTVVELPVVVADHDGEEFLVSMLGRDANWVRNVEAAGGDAVLRRRGRDVAVHLALVPIGDRAPILRRYIAVAPGARPHVGLGPSASLTEFERIAAGFPTFRIRTRSLSLNG